MKFGKSTIMLTILSLSMMAWDVYATDLGSWNNRDSYGLQHKIYMGMWSEHWYADNPEFNEENDVLQYSLYNNFRVGGEYLTVATFLNSYGDRTWAVGYGQDYRVYFLPAVKVGWDVGAMYGYGDNLDLNWRGITPAVKFHFSFYDLVKVQFMGPAVNVGFELTF